MALQAIKTAYHGPTQHRGARIIATCSAPDGRVSLPYDAGLSEDKNHQEAAKALQHLMHEMADWPLRTMVAGSHRGDYYWVYQHTNTYIMPDQGQV